MRASLKTRSLQAARIVVLLPGAQALRKAERDAIPVAGQTTGGDGQRRGDQCVLTAGDIREAACEAAADQLLELLRCLVVSVGKRPHLAELAFEVSGRHAMQQLGHEAAANALTGRRSDDDG